MSNWFRGEDGNKLDLFLEFLDSVSICLIMSFIGSKCKNVKLAQILSVTLKLVRLVVYGNR